VEEVSTHENKVDAFGESILFQDIDPRVKKIAGAFGQIVAGASKMNVSDVQETHGGILSLID
jgi:hypothetical protein